MSVERRPSDVLIVLDRSASMRRSLTADCLCALGPDDAPADLCADLAGCTDRWSTVKKALGEIVANPDLWWGLETFPFPADATCSALPALHLAIGGGSGALVPARLDTIAPAGNTPLAAAIDAAVAYLGALDDGNGKSIILATDGVPACAEAQPNAGDLADAVAAIAAAVAAGLPVYVLGAGPATSALDELAHAGGTGKHYPATSSYDLGNALSAISTTVMSCTLTFPYPPPDPNNVLVYIDKHLVPMDPDDGWAYIANGTAIELGGSYCDHLRIAWSTKVEVLFVCPGTAPPPCIP